MEKSDSMVRLLSLLKRRLLSGGGRKPRTIAAGLFRGCRLELDLASQSQVFLGLAERETHRYLRRAVHRWKWAVDVGAAEGELSVFLLKQAGLERVVAVEPNSSLIPALRRNLALNGQEADRRLEIRPVFAGTSDGPDHLMLDSLHLPSDQPGLLKIDVDGAELEVLLGSRQLLKGRVDVLVETHSRQLEALCIDYLDELGYQTRIVRNARWRRWIPEQRPLEHNRWLWASREMGSKSESAV